MYGTLRREDYWLHIVKIVFDIVQDCSQQPRMRTKFQQRQQLNLFPISGPFVFVAIGRLDRLPKTKIEKQFAVIITDR